MHLRAGLRRSADDGVDGRRNDERIISPPIVTPEKFLYRNNLAFVLAEATTAQMQLVFGARDLRFGGVRSKFRLADSDLLNHKVEVVEGVLGVECTELLRDFFARRR